ncbi:hypothetical protein [Novipirellula artificiosorum]|uniref:Uncharacterized protein n=1 Tax=Novipirellula artificiosorum TaxID=2528016 RepID=A0A5C6DUV4_9BACT|nr:hypothetical protein [Novipirellula artificiosorum]TWU39221.1 hypothetical protein Poly41_20430 [Novipirellula artificiosorum]
MRRHEGLLFCLLLQFYASFTAAGQQPEPISNPAYEKTLKGIQAVKTLAYTVTGFAKGKGGFTLKDPPPVSKR